MITQPHFHIRGLLRAALLALALSIAVAPAATAASKKHATKHRAARHNATSSGWVYIDSDNTTFGRNSVLVLAHGANGKLSPASIREYPTGGSGSLFVGGGNGVGTIAGDHEVLLSPNHKWLFAVNQGSNTIAVFKVNQATGALTPVHGSPFSSGGVAPISADFRNGHLVVANHGQNAPFNPFGSTPPGPASLVSFSVSPSGRLTQLSTVAAPSEGLINASLSPSGKNLFSTGFYSQKIHSLTVSGAGALAEGPGSPTMFPPSMDAGVTLPPYFPRSLIPLPFGTTVNPSKPFVYILGPANFRAATYKYDTAGNLTFVSQAENGPGTSESPASAVAACWDVITSNGRYLYTANSVSQTVSLFDVNPAGDGLTYVEQVKMPSTGTAGELAIDPANKYLYVLGEHDDPDAPRPQGVQPNGTIVDAPADGNFVDAFKIGPGGHLTAISSTALPVAFSQVPYGVATLGG